MGQHLATRAASASASLQQHSGVLSDAGPASCPQVYSGILSEQAFVGKESPGPQAYGARSTLGRQVGSEDH